MRFLLSFACVVTALSQTGAADLKMQFLFDGTPPAPKPIEVDRDKAVCGTVDLMDERLLVDAESKGIRNVVVYVYTGRGGTKLPPSPPSEQERRLAAVDCRFEPRVVLAQAGDNLVFDVTKAQVGHNANISFLRNHQSGLLVPARASRTYPLELSEPALLPIECNIHPWMKAWLVLLDHPFAAVSDAQGRLIIKGLPEDVELTFRVFHEDARRIETVKINGQEQQWDRHRFKVTLSATTTDLGQILLSPDVFQAVSDAEAGAEEAGRAKQASP